MSVDSQNYKSDVLGSKLRASLLASLFPAEVALASSNHDSEIIVPLILSPSKQQNHASFVLLLSSQIIPSFAEENIVLCNNVKSRGDHVALRDEGSLSAENPERINPAPLLE